jgi:transposase
MRLGQWRRLYCLGEDRRTRSSPSGVDGALRQLFTVPFSREQPAIRCQQGSKGGRPPTFDPEIYKQRRAVERGINRLRHNRGLATSYDKLAVRYQAICNIDAINEWL